MDVPVSTIDYTFLGCIIGTATSESSKPGGGNQGSNMIFDLRQTESAPYNGLINWMYCTKHGYLIDTDMVRNVSEERISIDKINTIPLSDLEKCGNVVCKIPVKKKGL